MTSRKPSVRIDSLDYLRGLFIIVIIIDHLWRWPNLFQFATGRGELWVSAAEGFVIISGLLVGYVRGWKNRQQPLVDVSKKLVLRGIMLYVWMIITTILITWATWAFMFKGNIAYVPYMTGDWSAMIDSMLHLQYSSILTYFLYLYGIFLILSPIVIWLLRKGQSWIVLLASLVGWGIGTLWGIEWLQWQIVFFIPTVAGYHLESILGFMQRLLPTTRRLITYGFIGATAAILVTSAIIVLPTEPGTYIDAVFTREPLSLSRIVVAFICFIGLLAVTQMLMPVLKKYTKWLLPVFGERSLTAYIVHIIPIMLCQYLFFSTTSFWINTLLTVACIMATWAILKIPYINKVIPR